MDLTVKAIELAEWFAENPFIGLGAIVKGHIVKEIAVAKLGEAVKTAILTQLGGGVPMPTPGGAPATKPGAKVPGKAAGLLGLAGKWAPLGAILYAGYEGHEPSREITNKNARAGG